MGYIFGLYGTMKTVHLRAYRDYIGNAVNP